MRRLRVLHIAAPARFGGLERVLAALAGGHRAVGHEVHAALVLTHAEVDHPVIRSLEREAVVVHSIVVPARAYRRERGAVASLCGSIRPQVVHTHGYRPDCIDSGVARRLGIPTVTTVHGFTRAGWKGRMYEWLQRRAFRRFDAVVAVSAAQVPELVRASVPRERIHVLRNAWRPGAAPLPRAEARARLGVPADRFHIGWVGRLGREKGADVFIEALARLDVEDALASIIGDGEERDTLVARAATEGVTDRIRWLGEVDDAARYFTAFDAFVLSSRTEGTPIVLLEAMAAGVPIVATAVGGVPDVVGPEDGLLVPPEDPLELAHAIARIRDDPGAAAERVEAGRQRLALFRLAPWLAGYEALYHRLALQGQGAVNVPGCEGRALAAP